MSTRLLLFVALGGAIGAALRYSVMSLVTRAFSDGYPWGTLVVNLVGCLAIGIVGGMISGRWAVSPEVRVLVIIGVLGGFTTFSSYGWDLLELLREDRYLAAFGYLAASNGCGLLGVWSGDRVAAVWLLGSGS